MAILFELKELLACNGDTDEPAPPTEGPEEEVRACALGWGCRGWIGVLAALAGMGCSGPVVLLMWNVRGEGRDVGRGEGGKGCTKCMSGGEDRNRHGCTQTQTNTNTQTQTHAHAHAQTDKDTDTNTDTDTDTDKIKVEMPLASVSLSLSLVSSVCLSS